jgi:predicted O-linked N-acetylglucosamine transferase (SPINDLY family)
MSLAQALALHRAGRRREARALYERALRQRPDDLQARFAYGLCLLEDGNLADGIAAMRLLVAARPDHAGAHQALGKALALGGDAAAAEAHLRRAVELAPEQADAWIELGGLLARRAPDEAERTLRAAVQRHPRHAGLWCNLGNLLVERGRRAEAAECWRKALAINPAQIEAELALALERRADGAVGEAVAMLERAIARRPDVAELHYNLGVTYYHARKPAEAVAALRRALAANPRFRKAAVQLAQVAQSVCDWDTLDRLMPLLEEEAAKAERGAPCLVTPFFALSLPFDLRRRAAIARQKGLEYERRYRADRQALAFGPPAPAQDGRLRIGFVGSEFRSHPMAHIIGGLFPLFDRRAFRVTVYSHGPDDGSEYRRRIARGAEAFVDLHGAGHIEAARRIAADGTDILIDLSAFTALARPEIAALRPAPVQATTMGLPGPSNAPFYDYVIADRIVVPPEHLEHYTEALVWLPRTYYFTDHEQPIAETAPTRAQEGLPAEGFVFACYCGHFKIERAAFACWMRLLQAVPGSVLWLYEESAESVRALRSAAVAQGVNPGRLVFGRRRPKPEHLARLALADLCVDTFTYGGHTTTVDALWAGVPVVTRLGDAFAGRVGASLLQAVGLPELVAPDLAAYEALALRLARDPRALAALRATLAANRLTQPLFDTPRFVRAMEEAFRRMWARHRAGERPALIDLGASADS